jgi:hypothetical protein
VGRPEVKADPLIALAEEILPRLKAAEWRDRAEAAAKDVDDIGLRDLRSVVAGGDAGARDDDSRILAKTLREALDRREAAARDAWVAEITAHLDEGRVARALRVAGRPPDPRTRFPAELAGRLTEAASNAMAPDTPPERWAALLAAVLESPVRRSVKPVGLPPTPPDLLLSAARQASGRVPALAAMLGLQMPPPPGPPRASVRPPAGRLQHAVPPQPAPSQGAPDAGAGTVGPDETATVATDGADVADAPTAGPAEGATAVEERHLEAAAPHVSPVAAVPEAHLELAELEGHLEAAAAPHVSPEAAAAPEVAPDAPPEPDTVADPVPAPDMGGDAAAAPEGRPEGADVRDHDDPNGGAQGPQEGTAPHGAEEVPSAPRW